MIDLDFYLELYGDKAFVKMTLHPDTICYLAQSVKYFHSINLHTVANCAYGICWTDEKTLSIYKEQLLELIQFYLDNPDITPCSLLNENIRVLAYETNYKPWCGIDKMTVFNIEGSGFPCHLFEELTLGKDKASKIPFLDLNNLIDYMDPVCKICKFICLCPICFGSNYKATGCFNRRDMNVCKTVKLQLYANAIFQLKKIEKYGIEIISSNPIEQKEVYEGILKISQFINPDEL